MAVTLELSNVSKVFQKDRELGVCRTGLRNSVS